MVIQEIVKGARYLARQRADIIKYGEKLIDNAGVDRALINELTPFRRLSNRGSSLSDSKYYIAKFEKEKGENFLPLDWVTMTESQKVDYIVKDRYTRLVANKSMNKLHELAKNDEVGIGKERLIELDADGNIIGYKDSSIEYKVEVQNTAKTKTSIHSHPEVFEEEELAALGHPNIKCSHSTGDMSTALALDIDSYVIDAQKHKFLLEPAKKIVIPQHRNFTPEQARTLAVMDASDPFLTEKVSRLKEKYIPLMEKSTNIYEYAKYKLQYILECAKASDEVIQESIEKGYCRFTELT